MTYLFIIIKEFGASVLIPLRKVPVTFLLRVGQWLLIFSGSPSYSDQKPKALKSVPSPQELVPRCPVNVAQLCPTLCDPMDYTVLEILQARILEWVAFPFSRGSSQPRDQTQLSRIAGGFFTS